MKVQRIASIAEAAIPPASSSEDRRRKPNSILHSLGIFIFLLSLGVSLLTHGAVYSEALAISTFLMALCVLIGLLGLGVPRAPAFAFKMTLLLWVAVILWSLLQAMPLPAGISGNVQWQSLEPAGIEAASSISIAPGETLSALLALSLPFLTMLAALMLFRSDRQAERAFSIFAFTGGIMAIFAIVQFSGFPESLMFGAKRFYRDSLTAPFVNRNTAATFYGIILVALIGRTAMAIAPQGSNRFGTAPQCASVIGPWIWLLLAIASGVALALTRSRGGILASVIACLFLVVGLALHFGARSGGRSLFGDKTSGTVLKGLLPGGIGVLGVLGLTWLLAGRAIFRAEVEAGREGRFCVLSGLHDAVAANFMTGVGPGTFASYFPAYRDPSCGLLGYWSSAHNVYLDAALAFGSLFSGLLLVVILLCAGRIYYIGLMHRKRRWPIVFIGISAGILVAIHSAIDFSLEVPGLSAMFITLISISSIISISCFNKCKYNI